VRQLIGLAGQFAAVDDGLTGRENLELVAGLYGLRRREARARSQEVLERLGLAQVGDRLVRTYSGGMRRRLDLGASLVGKPAVLIMDEPTTGLDPANRVALWRLIEDLVRDGTTMLLTTQYLEEADQLADQIVVIERGRVIAGGTPDELKQRLGGDVLEVRATSAADVERIVQTARRSRYGPARRRHARPARHLADDRTGPDAPCGRPPHRGVEHPDLRSRCAAALARRRLPRADGPGRGIARLRPTAVNPRARRDPDGPGMSTFPIPDGIGVGRSQNPWTFVVDTLRLTRRSLLLAVRMPQLIVLGLLLPTMFVLLFRYVFGGAIIVPGYPSYVDFLIPGIIVQTALFGGSSSAVGVADDLSKGATDRFRSLPTSRGAILAARTLADLVRLAYTIALIIGLGVLVGFRFHNKLAPGPRRCGARVALRLRDLMGLHLARALRAQFGDRCGRRLGHRLPARVRSLDVHVDRVDALLAQGVRRSAAGQLHGQCDPCADAGSGAGAATGALRRRVVVRPHRRFGEPRNLALQEDLDD